MLLSLSALFRIDSLDFVDVSVEGFKSLESWNTCDCGIQYKPKILTYVCLGELKSLGAIHSVVDNVAVLALVAWSEDVCDLLTLLALACQHS